MDSLATQLETITALRQVFAYPPDAITATPAAFVDYPTITFDDTYGGLTDVKTFQVEVLVPAGVDRVARSQLAPFCSVSGTSSVRAALESGDYVFSVPDVKSITFDFRDYNDVKYRAAIFEIEVTGSEP